MQKTFLGLEIQNLFQMPTIQSSGGARKPAEGLRLNTLGVGTGVGMPRRLDLFTPEMRSLTEKNSSHPWAERTVKNHSLPKVNDPSLTGQVQRQASLWFSLLVVHFPFSTSSPGLVDHGEAQLLNGQERTHNLEGLASQERTAPEVESFLQRCNLSCNTADKWNK